MKADDTSLRRFLSESDWDWICELHASPDATVKSAKEGFRAWFRELERTEVKPLGTVQQTIDIHGESIRFRLLIQGVKKSQAKDAAERWKEFGGNAKIQSVKSEIRKLSNRRRTLESYDEPEVGETEKRQEARASLLRLSGWSDF